MSSILPSHRSNRLFTKAFLALCLLFCAVAFSACPEGSAQEPSTEKTTPQEIANEPHESPHPIELSNETIQETSPPDATLPDATLPEEHTPEPVAEALPPESSTPEEAAPEATPDGFCGDKRCDPTETPQSCPQDCPRSIWQPKLGTTWHWQLTGSLDMNVNVQMYDIDLFDTSAQTIAQLQAKGRTVICYFSAGSYEDWRPDKAAFPAAAKGLKMDGWDELWLDIRAANVRDIMRKRLDLAQQKGCDGVEPDNVDGYQNKTGFPLTAQDQLDFNRFLAKEAHQRSLSIGLKNDLDQVKQLVGDFDWALNEECLSYSECNLLQPFLDAGKAVFHVEYDKTKSQICPKVPTGFSSMIKHWDLDAWATVCW